MQKIEVKDLKPGDVFKGNVTFRVVNVTPVVGMDEGTATFQITTEVVTRQIDASNVTLAHGKDKVVLVSRMSWFSRLWEYFTNR